MIHLVQLSGGLLSLALDCREKEARGEAGEPAPGQ
jgi:hypothetical protein